MAEAGERSHGSLSVGAGEASSRGNGRSPSSTAPRWKPGIVFGSVGIALGATAALLVAGGGPRGSPLRSPRPPAARSCPRGGSSARRRSTAARARRRGTDEMALTPVDGWLVGEGPPLALRPAAPATSVSLRNRLGLQGTAPTRRRKRDPAARDPGPRADRAGAVARAVARARGRADLPACEGAPEGARAGSDGLPGAARRPRARKRRLGPSAPSGLSRPSRPRTSPPSAFWAGRSPPRTACRGWSRVDQTARAEPEGTAPDRTAAEPRHEVRRDVPLIVSSGRDGRYDGPLRRPGRSLSAGGVEARSERGPFVVGRGAHRRSPAHLGSP